MLTPQEIDDKVQEIIDQLKDNPETSFKRMVSWALGDVQNVARKAK